MGVLPLTTCCGKRFDQLALAAHVKAVHNTWWIDVAAGELVRSADGQRWDTREVPELARSGRKRDAVDLQKIDEWVAAQSTKGD